MQVMIDHYLKQHQTELVIIWRLREGHVVDLDAKLQEADGLRWFAQWLRSHRVLGVTDRLELLISVKVTHIEHAQVSLYHIHQQVGEGDKVVAAAHRLEVHGIGTSHRHVSIESVHCFHLDMLPIFIEVIAAEPEVDKPYLSQGTWRGVFVTNENIVQFKIIVDLTDFVQFFELL